MFGVVWFLWTRSTGHFWMQSWYWEFAFIRKTSTQWWSQDSNEVSREFPLIEGWKGLIRHLTVFLCLIETDLWMRLVFATILYQNNCTSHRKVNYAILLMSLIHVMILMRLKYGHLWKSWRQKRRIFIIPCHNCQLFISLGGIITEIMNDYPRIFFGISHRVHRIRIKIWTLFTEIDNDLQKVPKWFILWV